MNKILSAEKIVFIGAGKVATALGMVLKRKRKIIQVYSRNSTSAKRLAEKLACSDTHNLNKISTEADLYIIAVKDDAISKVASGLKLKGKAVVHTSGSVGIDVLKKASAECGVLYPVHSFAGNKPLATDVPFCIEASAPKVKKQLNLLVKEMGGKAYYMDSLQRAELHLAAVFANNFSNYMFAIADDITGKANIPFEVLFHLIDDSVSKIRQQEPALNQTGPAVRGDKGTLKKHEAMLKKNLTYLAIYKLISKSIEKSFKR